MPDECDDTPVVDHGYHDERVRGCRLCYPPRQFDSAGFRVGHDGSDRYDDGFSRHE
jgi:hypothetical protein